MRFSRHPILRSSQARASRLSRARGLLGTHIRLVRRSSWPLAAVGHNTGAVQSRKFGLATWFGSRPARSTGTVRHRQPAMTHIAIQEKKDGKVVDWMEHVSDEQYRK